MAEQIPYNVAASFINRLGSLAFREFGRIYGVTDELERLKNTVESIKAVLLDADQRQEHDRAVQLWIARLKEVLHAADDLFDDVATRDLLLRVDRRNKIAKEVRRFFSSSNPIVFRRQMAKKIDKIRRKFNDVVEDASKLNLIPRPVADNQTESACRETSSFVLESDIIGRADSKKEILNMLREPHGSENVSLIAIVGIGGLGKTAIAQLVFNDVEVQRLFETRLWVCVSDDFDVKTIVRKILDSLIGSKCDGQESLDNLQNKLRENLNGKRYLLVMDDIWNESYEKWSQLGNYLMCGAQGSKILVTTRNEIVAQTMGVSTSFFLKGLTTEQSWSLLKKIAFGHDIDEINDTLEPIGKKIAENCKGVPLAIRTVGGILRGKNKDSEWINVLEGDLWKLREDKNGIMPILKLSYQKLLPQLRQCFAYCSIYPKDWEVEKNELIQLWMAQGYLECSRQHMEDVGNQFVETLMMKSFFQDAQIDELGNIRSFKMHDLMHDLASLAAGSDCYLDSEKQEFVGRPMHMSLDYNAIGLLDSSETSLLRTLFLQPAKKFKGHVKWRRMLCNPTLQSIRVLNLSNSYFLDRLPDSIGELRHLRYLDLSECRVLKSLPKSMSNLVNLQTLKLKSCVRLEFSTKVVTRLINLRHLDISYCKAFEDMMPIGLGKLTSLESLPTFVVGDYEKKRAGQLNELKDLNNLRGSLTIKGLGRIRNTMMQSQEVNLEDKKHLQSLRLGWEDERIFQNNDDSLQLLEHLRPHQHLKALVVSRYPGMKFSDWLSSLTNISDISLWSCDRCRYLPPLERLPSLKSLDITFMEALECIYFEMAEAPFFPALEKLRFYECNRLRGWQRMGHNSSSIECLHHLSMPSFPRLSELTIIECPKLTCMPAFPCLNGKLCLQRCNVNPLTETLNRVSPSSLTPLSMLKSLKMVGPNLDTKRLPSQWMRNLTSLQHLEMSWYIDGFETWFWKDIDCVPSLRKLEVRYCKIRNLPDWVCNSLSLQHIAIIGCDELARLPEGMPRLTNLHTLEVHFCAILRERCLEERGADWPKIAHIPNLIILPRI